VSEEVVQRGQIQKWADKAMFAAAPIDVSKGPQVELLSCNNDPLGTIAAAAKMYAGESVTSLSQITDAERRHYLADTRKNALAAPLEFVNFHFIISGVTRGFTHQMVRQRTATYTQESTRFAVKEDVPVGYPPSLDGTMSWDDWWEKCGGELFPILISELNEHQIEMVDDYAKSRASQAQNWRREWDGGVNWISQKYNILVNSGMPAEDARGLLPTNLLTRINYNTSLRGLLEHSGLRLCTQAQFEWRLVWARIKEAIVSYGLGQKYLVYEPSAQAPNMRNGMDDGLGDIVYECDSDWQFDELSTIFKPICYQKGECQFLSDIDRHCTIRERVQLNADMHRPSTEWDVVGTQAGTNLRVAPIADEEWMLDPTSARVSQ
jgi:flavin-dependent thymidylate synthase